MAYQTGASADIATLLSALRGFAIDNGWGEVANDSYTLSFIKPAVGSARHDNNSSMVSSVSASDAYLQQSEGTIISNHLALSRNGVTWQLFAFHKKLIKNGVNGIYACLEMWACDGWNSGVAPHLQSNNRKGSLIGPLATSLYAYHLFTNGDYIHLVIEETPGQFRHLSLGFLKKYGVFDGGQYLTSGCPIETSTTIANDFISSNAMIPFGANSTTTYKSTLNIYGFPGTIVRADIDGLTNGWRFLTTGYETTGIEIFGCGTYSNASRSRGGPSGTAAQNSLAHDLAYHCSPLSWNGAAPMVPCYVGVFRTPYNGNWTLLGEFPDVRFLNISNLNPGDELNLGTDTWKIFPVFAKDYTLLSSAISYDYGLAYRKVA